MEEEEEAAARRQKSSCGPPALPPVRPTPPGSLRGGRRLSQDWTRDPRPAGMRSSGGEAGNTPWPARRSGSLPPTADVRAGCQAPSGGRFYIACSLRSAGDRDKARDLAAAAGLTGGSAPAARARLRGPRPPETGAAGSAPLTREDAETSGVGGRCVRCWHGD